MGKLDPSYFLERLYPFQDEVLAVISSLKTGLYLSGGTAISRGYLQHRFSEDLDLLADDTPDFALWTARAVRALGQDAGWRLEVIQREERLVRLVLSEPRGVLRIELINDVPARVGAVGSHPVLGLLDCPENLLANKISALLDRNEPKDLADIWGLCKKLGLSPAQAIEGAQGKAAGVFPLDLARALSVATEADWATILWHSGPDAATFVEDLHALGESLIGL